jgi:hypothetical protein
VGHVAGLGDKKNAYSVLLGIREGTRRLGMLGLRWVDNIKVNIKRYTIDWIHMARGREMLQDSM